MDINNIINNWFAVNFVIFSILFIVSFAVSIIVLLIIGPPPPPPPGEEAGLQSMLKPSSHASHTESPR